MAEAPTWVNSLIREIRELKIDVKTLNTEQNTLSDDVKDLHTLKDDVKELKDDVKTLKTVFGEITKVEERLRNLTQLSGGEPGDVTEAELGELSRIIVAQDMHQIGVMHLGFLKVDLDNERNACGDNQWKFNFNVLCQWKCKNAGQESRKKLDCAMKNASQGGLVNYLDVQRVLGTDVEEVAPPVPETPKQPDGAVGGIMGQGKLEIAESSDEEQCEGAVGGIMVYQREPEAAGEDDQTIPNQAQRELTEVHLFDIATRITSKSELYTLGLQLHMAMHSLERHIVNNRDDMPAATYSFLFEWLKRQPSNADAYRSLAEALRRANMNYYVDKCLE